MSGKTTFLYSYLVIMLKHVTSSVCSVCRNGFFVTMYTVFSKRNDTDSGILLQKRIGGPAAL